MCIDVYAILGELFELKADLNTERKDVRKDAIKKVIASMTIGKDVRCVTYCGLLFGHTVI